MNEEINWIVENWDKISDEFKMDIRSKYWTEKMNNLNGLDDDEHTIVVLLNRQKPSIESDYSFNEERIGVTKTGKVIWGFDSGCSCPSPWVDSYPDCYTVTKEWKQFEVDANGFDEDWKKECLTKIEKIKSCVK
jgi:hypothetical protein